MDLYRVWLRLNIGNKEHIHFILNNTSNLYHGAAELGNSRAYYSIGNAYDFGRGVERDEKKAAHYYGLAAMGGDVEARNRGASRAHSGNWERALKHWMISTGNGDDDLSRASKYCL